MQFLSPDLRGLNETTWEHITWHTVDLEKKMCFIITLVQIL